MGGFLVRVPTYCKELNASIVSSRSANRRRRNASPDSDGDSGKKRKKIAKRILTGIEPVLETIISVLEFKFSSYQKLKRACLINISTFLWGCLGFSRQDHAIYMN